MRTLEQERWLWDTPIGAIFASAWVSPWSWAAVVVYMVLSNDVANHIHEYATLKAMGYNDLYLSGVVMQQAIAMAILGYAVSLVCAEVLYRLVGYWANLPMVMTWSIRLLVLALSVGMCCISGVGHAAQVARRRSGGSVLDTSQVVSDCWYARSRTNTAGLEEPDARSAASC